MEGDLLARITHEQRRAANPRASAWVSANAGSGKTKVLSDRVLRLLLSGTPPGKILCLTFTKAAAANMAIRIFERLGRWVTLDEAGLVKELTELEGRRPDPEDIRFARRLFARAVETPGGLKIETIHAFCERILHMVPFEANVPARFTVLDEDRSGELLAEAVAAVLADAESDSSVLKQARDAVVAEAAGERFDTLLRSTVQKRWLFEHESRPAETIRRLRRALRVPADASVAGLEREMLEGGIPPSQWPGLAEILDTGSKTDREQGRSLRAAFEVTDAKEKLTHYRGLFFTKSGERRERPVTKKLEPVLGERLGAEQARLEALDELLKGAEAIERTEALFALCAAIRRRVEVRKAAIGALDFDDLIAKTLTVLSRGETAWILYKLDRGIEHVLVDEAQDTNPEQWEILRKLTEDFTAGRGAAGERIRTIFAVGDPKQSIYGFQGAEPKKFEESRRHWRKAVTEAALPFEDVPLIVSFRSVRAVLSAVDATFAIAEHYRGLSFDEGAVGTVHETYRAGAPGLVELWPVERPADSEEPEAWVLPVDQPEPTAPPVLLAQRIAKAVRTWTTEGDEWGRRWSPGDVLILVKKRGAAFMAVIRELKRLGVRVAGADRLNVGEHIAVQDLVAAGRAALLPEDDLTLAEALKSPLVGLDDEDLIRLAASRPDAESLADALRRHAASGDGAAARASAALDTWRDLAMEHGPFGFYATILGPLAGRRLLVARLGSEAGDAIDAFLSLAHDAERAETPSLTSFLLRFESTDHQVKRDLEATGDEVRVMTVHGAKGLEAPIVILVDGCQILGPPSPLLPVVTDPTSLEAIPLWAPRKADDSAAMAEARQCDRLRAIEEHNRLLYVAMTRAKDRLVIAPYTTNGNETPAEAWCEMVRRGLTRKVGGLVRQVAPYGEVELWRDGGQARHDGATADEPDPLPLAEPHWLRAAVEPEPEPAPPIRPSSALAAADPAPRPAEASSNAEARLRGTIVHTLLERLPTLPEHRREGAARAFVAARAPKLRPEERAGIVAGALKVLAHEALAPLFGPGSRAEAPIAGRLGQSPVFGQIDRLAVTETEVLIADFKTSARPPAPEKPLPEAYVGQLALYRHLLGEIYPSRRIRAFLVWTAGPEIRELSPDELDGALARITGL